MKTFSGVPFQDEGTHCVDTEGRTAAPAGYGGPQHLTIVAAASSAIIGGGNLDGIFGGDVEEVEPLGYCLRAPCGPK